MKSVTRWSPDTCKCIIDFEWDDLDSSVSVKKIVKPCKDHENSGDDVTHFNKVLEENQRKNIAIGKMISEIPRVTETIVDSRGSTTIQIKPTIDIGFSYDDKRNLILDIPSLTKEEQTVVKSACSSIGKENVYFKGDVISVEEVKRIG